MLKLTKNLFGFYRPIFSINNSRDITKKTSDEEMLYNIEKNQIGNIRFYFIIKITKLYEYILN